MNQINYYVSIIIPVFNDKTKLKLCLDALSQQTFHSECFEIIIADNASTQDIRYLVKNYSQARYTYENLPGSYAARNSALKIARGNILGFTDADCIPDSNWIENGVNRLLTEENCGFIAGQINFFFEDPNQPSIAELFDSKNFLNQRRYVEEESFGATANLFTFRHIFDTVGIFNTDLKSGGDREWGKRVSAAGYKGIYADEVRISHPARLKISDLKKKVSRIVEGQFKSDKKSIPSKSQIIKEYLKDSKPSLRGILEIMQDETLPNIWYRIGFVYIYISLRQLRAWKRLQMQLK